MKATVSSLTDLPEVLRGEYQERDGKYVLKIEGSHPGFVPAEELAEANAKVTEFRDNNRRLASQNEELKTRFDGFDPDEHKKLKTKLADLEKQGVKPDTDVSALIQRAIEENVTPLQAKLDEITQREKDANAKLARKELEGVLTQEGLKVGVREQAMADFIRRGLDVWSWEDGRPVAKNGDTPLYSKRRPAEPLSPTEWVGLLAHDAPHLFNESNGGGAQNGRGGTGSRLTYDPNNQADFLKNIETIAKGEGVPIE